MPSTGLTYANIVPCIAAAQSIGRLVEAWDIAISINQYLILRGDLATAIDVSESAVALARELGDEEKEADALNNLGLDLNYAHRYTDAKPHFLLARRLFRKHSIIDGEARVMVGLAESMRGEGHTIATIPILQRAVKMHTVAGAYWSVGFAMTNLGTSLRELGRLAEAEKVLRGALMIHTDNMAWRAVAATLGQLGTAIGEAGRLDEAIAMLSEAKRLAELVNDYLLIGAACTNSGNFHRLAKNNPQAEKLFESALDAFLKVDSIRNAAMTCVSMVWMYEDAGDRDKAQQAMTVLRGFGDIGEKAAQWAKRRGTRRGAPFRSANPNQFLR